MKVYYTNFHPEESIEGKKGSAWRLIRRRPPLCSFLKDQPHHQTILQDTN